MKYWPPRLIASAHVASDGSLSRAVGIDAVNVPLTGTYEVVLAENYEANSLHISVAPQGAPRLWGFTESLPPTSEVSLEFQNGSGAAAETSFTIRVYKDA